MDVTYCLAWVNACVCALSLAFSRLKALALSLLSCISVLSSSSYSYSSVEEGDGATFSWPVRSSSSETSVLELLCKLNNGKRNKELGSVHTMCWAYENDGNLNSSQGSFMLPRMRACMRQTDYKRTPQIWILTHRSSRHYYSKRYQPNLTFRQNWAGSR